MAHLTNVKPKLCDFHVPKCPPGNTGKERLLGLRSVSFKGKLAQPPLQRTSHVKRLDHNQRKRSIVTTEIETLLYCQVTIGVQRGNLLQGRLE